MSRGENWGREEKRNRQSLKKFFSFSNRKRIKDIGESLSSLLIGQN
jgi:hypothetical protein